MKSNLPFSPVPKYSYSKGTEELIYAKLTANFKSEAKDRNYTFQFKDDLDSVLYIR